MQYKNGQLVKAFGRINPLLVHYGILLVDEKGTVYIAHNSYSKPSILELYSDFAKNRKIISITDTHLIYKDYNFLKQRYLECKKPYDVLTYNCEHFLYCMLNQPIQSSQVIFWTVELPLFALFLRAIAK